MTMPHTNHKKTENAASTVKFSPYKTPKNFVWRLQTPNKAQKPQNFAIHRTISVYQHFIIIIISAIFFPVCEMAHFALQYRPYHHTKSTKSRPDMVVFATRKSPFRKTGAL